MNIFLLSCSRLVRRNQQNVRADLVDILGQLFQRYSENSIFIRFKLTVTERKKTARSENFHG